MLAHVSRLYLRAYRSAVPSPSGPTIEHREPSMDEINTIKPSESLEMLSRSSVVVLGFVRPFVLEFHRVVGAPHRQCH
jgi:hypothetical protein